MRGDAMESTGRWPDKEPQFRWLDAPLFVQNGKLAGEFGISGNIPRQKILQVKSGESWNSPWLDVPTVKYEDLQSAAPDKGEK